MPFCIRAGKIQGSESPGLVEVTHLSDPEWKRVVCLVHMVRLSAVSILLARKGLPLPRKGFVRCGHRSTSGQGPLSHSRKLAESWASVFAVGRKLPHFHTLPPKQVDKLAPFLFLRILWPVAGKQTMVTYVMNTKKA